MLTTKSLIQTMFRPLTHLTKSWMSVHLTVWLLTALMINIPYFRLTFGLFHSADYSLLVPTLYGVWLNALIFYGNSQLIITWMRLDHRQFIKLSLALFIGVCLLETLFDTISFLVFYGHLTIDVTSETLTGSILMNGIFFYAPSFIFGFFLDWKKEDNGTTKILVQDGHKTIFLNPNDLLFVESDGNYSIFHTQSDKVLERKSLASIECELPLQFVRCHKSFIINTRLVDKRSYAEVQVAGRKIPVGRKYKDQLTSALR